MRDIVTHLAFADRAEEAVRFYTDLIPDSRITGVTHFGPDEPGPAGTVRTIRFEMLGQKFLAVNGGEHFTFTDGVSLLVRCDTQQEIDRLWDALAAGGSTSVCGWLTDRYGLAWQIVPAVAEEYIYDPDPAASQRAVKAIYGMTKINIAELDRAYHQRQS